MSKQTDKLAQLLEENAIGEEEFTNCLGIDASMTSDLLSGRKILSRSLARQIEQTFSKPENWLDSHLDSQGGDYDLFG